MICRLTNHGEVLSKGDSGLCNVERLPNFLAVKAYFFHFKKPLKRNCGRGKSGNPFRNGDQSIPSRVSNNLKP
jgi:hypothetical protein